MKIYCRCTLSMRDRSLPTRRMFGVENEASLKLACTEHEITECRLVQELCCVFDNINVACEMKRKWKKQKKKQRTKLSHGAGSKKEKSSVMAQQSEK